jgi:hypothetical protein
MTTKPPHLIERRWRVMVAGALGIAGIVLARHFGLPDGLSGLIGWNAAAAIYLTTTLAMVWNSDEASVRRRAAYEDENHSVTAAIVLSAVVAGKSDRGSWGARRRRPFLGVAILGFDSVAGLAGGADAVHPALRSPLFRRWRRRR